MAHTNIHDPLHVYSIQELPLTQLPVENTIDTLHLPPEKPREIAFIPAVLKRVQRLQES